MDREVASLSKPTGDDCPSNWHWKDGKLDAGPVVIVDIDDVLANAFERMRGIEEAGERWPEFFLTADEDDVNEEAVRLVDLLCASLTIVLLSARPLSAREMTIEWLRRHSVRWDLLILRSTNSMQNHTHYKRDQVRELKKRGYKLTLSLDDDPGNVEMYRGEGVPCLHVRSLAYEV